MMIYIYNRIRPLLVLPFFVLFFAANMVSPVSRGDYEGTIKDSTVTFIKDGVELMPGETLSCTGFDELHLVYWLPQNVESKYDMVKFYLYVDDKEYKTRDFKTRDMNGKKSWTLIAVTKEKKKHSNFDDLRTNFLEKHNVCTAHADAAYKGYKIKAVAKGYKQTGTNKKGMPLYMNNEIFAESTIYVNTTGQSVGKK